MFRLCLSLSALSALLLCSPVWADAENGKELHDESCISCHMMDDHEALYSREKRIVDSLHALGGQVSNCTQVLNVSWFPDDERDVVDYLNSNYYKFTK